jgi:NTE family protein
VHAKKVEMAQLNLIDKNDPWTLSLSGGGFRATLFHLGAVMRLNELGVLGRLDQVVSVSGGSILAGYLGSRWKDLHFENNSARNFSEVITKPLSRFCSRNVELWTFARGLPRPWCFRRPGNLLAGSFRFLLFGRRRLNDLPSRPDFRILTTNILSGCCMEFSKQGLSSVAATEHLYIGDAVAASSAFPPIFSPYSLSLKARFRGVQKFVGEEFYFCDAGVIDNLGLQYPSYGTIFVSDASAPFRRKSANLKNRAWSVLAVRALTVASSQGAEPRLKTLLKQLKSRQGAYWNICSWRDSLPLANISSSERIAYELGRTPTRLCRFSKQVTFRLINWGYLCCEMEIRHRAGCAVNCPPTLPYPEYPLNPSYPMNGSHGG